MTVLSLRAGAASEMVHSKPPRPDLGPNQIAWCRQWIPLFAIMQDRALRSREEMEDAR